MHILLLSDGIVGHYKQSEGIVAALARERTVTVTRFNVPLPRIFPRKLLSPLSWYLPSKAFLSLCGISPAQFQKPDLIVSAGGATLGFNTAFSRYFNTPNIFSGSARGFAPQRITLTLTPYPSAATLEGHLYALKPSPVDPDRLRPIRPWQGFEQTEASLLIGGSTPHTRFSGQEWRTLLAFIVQTTLQKNMHWHVVTSRRTPDNFYAALEELSSEERARFRITDFRTQGAGSIDDAFKADILFVTGDSLSMISESVATNRPTVALFPAQTSPFRDHEAVKAMADEKRLVSVPITGLDVESLEKNVAALHCGNLNHLDSLAQSLLSRLPL